MSSGKAPAENMNMQEMPDTRPAIDLADLPNDWLRSPALASSKSREKNAKRQAEHIATVQEKSRAKQHARNQKQAERIARDRARAMNIRPRIT